MGEQGDRSLSRDILGSYLKEEIWDVTNDNNTNESEKQAKR